MTAFHLDLDLVYKCHVRSDLAGTVQHAQVLTRPSFWEIFLLKPEYRNPDSQPLCGSGPEAATTVAASHSAAYARNAAPAPTPQPVSIYYVNQPHADLITHAHAR